MKNQKPDNVNPWKTITARNVYDNNWINVTEYDVINPAGGKGIYGKVHFKNIAIGIIPIDTDGNTWLVGQYRFTLNQYSWEIPEGGGPIGIPPLESAKRELKEETGLTAKDWKVLMRLHNSNSVTDEEAIIFLAENLEHGEGDLEDTEADLVVKKLPFKQALEMVMNGEMTDSMSVAGILKVAHLKNL
ncbi:MAG: NUDIX hydrolase [Cyclobacteriaceae bacterium]|nr:NUDIX hydrolase [Cyclobacteriaceae bacterium]